MELRPYQQETVSELINFWLRNNLNAGLCVLPTASGKTVVFAEFIREALLIKPETKVLILGHTQEIVEQNAEKLITVWPEANVGIYCAGLKRKEIKQVTSASRDSIIKEIGKFADWDIVIVDEAHLISPELTTRYQFIISTIQLHGKKPFLLGFTATPFRTKSGNIYGDDDNQLFKKLIYQKRIDELQSTGYLCPLRAVVTDFKAVVDTSKVRRTKQDFVQTELQAVTAIGSVVTDIVQDWLNKTNASLPTVFYASSVQQAEIFADVLKIFGFDFPLITAKTEKILRKQWLNDFEVGEQNGLINVATLTTGWDAPRLSCIVMARPTLSPGLFLQILGRGLRLHKSKFETLLLDYGENLERFGVIERVGPIMESRFYHDEKSLIIVCPTCETIASIYQLECDACTETLRHEDDVSVCYECNSPNDRYAKYCEVCGEALEENMGFYQ